ncbi:MAG TPA: hypothetical protein VD965_08460 [Burkholderiales bacterium]|nr:hypothetical protein [Burkholderiales bacterium]
MGKLPLQEIAKAVTVAAVFLAVILLLTSGRALGADVRSERYKAMLADEAEELRRLDEKHAQRRPLDRATARQAARQAFERVCVIKPVMADREIEACRVSYRRKDI